MEQLLKHPAARRFLSEDGRINWAKVDAAQDWEIRFAIADLPTTERRALRKEIAAYQPSTSRRALAALGGVNIEKLRQRLLGLLAD